MTNIGRLIHLKTLYLALLISINSGCSGKSPHHMEMEGDESRSLFNHESNRVAQYRVVGVNNQGVNVTEVFGIRLGEEYTEDKYGGNLAVHDAVSLNVNPNAWAWRRSDPEIVVVAFEPPQPNPLFSEYLLLYDKQTRRILGVEGWATNSSRQCGSLREKLIDVLEEKYSFQQEITGREDGPKVGVTKDEIEITVGCDQLRLLYFDLKPIVNTIEIDASSL